MRLPFPERIPFYKAASFGIILCVLQQLAGTTLLFTGCTFAFICLATLAFNITGGLTQTSGWFITAYSLLAVIFGIMWKAIQWEPAQSNLQQPERTIEVYLGTIFSIFVAAWLARRVRLKKSYIPQFTSDSHMGRAAVGCLMLGGSAFVYGILRTSSSGAGSLIGIFLLLSSLLAVAMVLAVFSEIRRSGGRRSMNAVAMISGGLIFFGGIIAYSKQGLLTPFVCWMLPAAANRFKVSVLQVAGIVLALGFVTYYLVPYSQYGRVFRIEGAPFTENLKVSISLLSNLDVVRRVNNQHDDELRGEGISSYFDHPQGFADRLQMITPDDLIISYTEAGHVFGIAPTIYAYLNLIPHLIWKSKPIINYGNTYANELGLLGGDDVEDTTTGVSFSPSGDAYHQAKWLGILVLLPVLTFILFFVADNVCGDTRNSPFALLLAVAFLHSAPEGGLTEIAHGATGTMISTVVIAFVTIYIMPLFANLVMGSREAQDAQGKQAITTEDTVTQAPATAEGMSNPVTESVYRWSRGRAKA